MHGTAFLARRVLLLRLGRETPISPAREIVVAHLPSGSTRIPVPCGTIHPFDLGRCFPPLPRIFILVAEQVLLLRAADPRPLHLAVVSSVLVCPFFPLRYSHHHDFI